MSNLDGNAPPGTPPPSGPPKTPPNQPTGPGRPPANPPPPSKDVMFRRRYPKQPKAPKPPAGLHGNCRKAAFSAAFLTLKAMWTHRRDLPALWRDTEAY